MATVAGGGAAGGAQIWPQTHLEGLIFRKKSVFSTCEPPLAAPLAVLGYFLENVDNFFFHNIRGAQGGAGATDRAIFSQKMQFFSFEISYFIFW